MSVEIQPEKSNWELLLHMVQHASRPVLVDSEFWFAEHWDPRMLTVSWRGSSYSVRSLDDVNGVIGVRDSTGQMTGIHLHLVPTAPGTDQARLLVFIRGLRDLFRDGTELAATIGTWKARNEKLSATIGTADVPDLDL